MTTTGPGTAGKPLRVIVLRQKGDDLFHEVGIFTLNDAGTVVLEPGATPEGEKLLRDGYGFDGHHYTAADGEEFLRKMTWTFRNPIFRAQIIEPRVAKGTSFRTAHRRLRKGL